MKIQELYPTTASGGTPMLYVVILRYPLTGSPDGEMVVARSVFFTFDAADALAKKLSASALRPTCWIMSFPDPREVAIDFEDSLE
jgi:hypothetical protein